jgi:glycosyltransferase involved in cell wall biosynthesis
VVVKILHFIYDDRRNPWVAGGGAVRAFEIYRRLTTRVDATIVTGNYPGARSAEEAGVRFLRVGAARPYAWSRLTYGLRSNLLIRREPYDAAVFDYSAYTPIFLPRTRPVGAAVHHLTGPTARARWGRIAGGGVAVLERAMLRRVAFVSLSAGVVEPEIRALAAPGADVMLVGAGVGDEFFRVHRREEDFLLFFGRLDVFQKGLDVLVEAFALLRSEHPDLRLRIAGRGKDAAQVERLLARAGVADATELLGPVSDERRLELLASATLMLMPSRFEGFGLVAAEAMAAGVPLVASDAGSLPEVVAPPAGGVTVPAGDAAALARAAAALLADAGARADLSRTARESARRFTWDAVAERHHRFLEGVARSSDP